jgi:hypothetical protein
MNDSDSGVGSFSEISDGDTCKVNSPFSSSSNKEDDVVQPEPDRGKKTRRAFSKRANRYFEIEWKGQIQTVQKPAFSGIPDVNKNFHITQVSSPWDIFGIFFSPQIFKLIQKIFFFSWSNPVLFSMINRIMYKFIVQHNFIT